MKKRFIALLTVLVLAISITSIFAVQAAEEKALDVKVNADGTVTIKVTGDYDDVVEPWVGIYYNDETYNPNEGGATSLVWWYLSEGTEVTYPGENPGITVDTTNRPNELSEGAGSALLPGKYTAIILGGETSYDLVVEGIDFEIPETSGATATATAGATATATATATAEATATATAKATTTATAKTTAKTTSTPATNDTDSSNTWIWIICIVAAVIIIAAIVIIIVMKKKKK